MSNDIPRKVMQTIHRDAYHPWMVIGLVILVATEAADFVLSYTACELLLGGNLTGAGLTTAAERAQGLTAGIEALVVAAIASALILVIPMIAGRKNSKAMLVLPAGLALTVAAIRLYGQLAASASGNATGTGIAAEAMAGSATGQMETAALFALLTLVCMVSTIALSYILSREMRRSAAIEKEAKQAYEYDLQIARAKLASTQAGERLKSGEAIIDAALLKAKAEIDALTNRW